MKLPRAVQNLCKWTDTEASRYALSGVRIWRMAGRAYAEATDGRRFARLEWESEGGAFTPKIIDGKGLAKAMRAVPKKQAVDMADYPNGVANVNGAEVPTIDGRYPKTDDLLEPERIGTVLQQFTPARLRELANHTLLKVGSQSVLVDSRYLVDLADQAEAVGAGTVTVKVSDPQSQVVCEGEGKGGVNMTAVIMPLAAD